MAAPTLYTETTFKAYLHRALKQLPNLLGWSVDGGSYDDIVDDTLLLLELDDIANTTSIGSLRAVGIVVALETAKRDIAHMYTFSMANAKYDRNHILKVINDMHKDAVRNPLYVSAPGVASQYQVKTTSIDYAHDPYRADQDTLFHQRDLE